MQDTTRVLFLKELKEFLKTSDIKADKVCIVGSSSLAALGIRENRPGHFWVVYKLFPDSREELQGVFWGGFGVIV